MRVFEPSRKPVSHRAKSRRSGGLTLTELLVAMSIVLVLASMAVAAVAAAGGHQKKVRTRALIAKIDAIITPQYESYAGRNVDATSGSARGAKLREMVTGDLPDSWDVVAALAAKPESDLTPHQRAYVAAWTSIDRSTVAARNAAAECLFLAVMHGGLADCLDCESLRIDVGDTDGDNMPEFLDAWGNPIGFVLMPRGLELPPGGGKKFFSATLPFDPVVGTMLDAKVSRPLVVSAGPDGAFGLGADASPAAGSSENRDNLTNFDEEARG